MKLSESKDTELVAVATEWLRQDPSGLRTARVLRDTFDQLYDGQRTGRYRWDQLYKTEKTHCGTLVEINLQREFKFTDGLILDYRIAGFEVDCKYSQTVGGWMIPPETRGRLCVVLSATDGASPLWNMGLVRAIPAHLNPGVNRDGKTSLSATGKSAIVWLFRNTALPSNVLLQLQPQAVAAIFRHRSGQKRINDLFRLGVGRIVGRAAVATVAQQSDYMKRVRANGGARTTLQPEGIIILGQFSSHKAIAMALGFPSPGPGDSLSVRVTPASAKGPGVAIISGRFWRVAKAGDPVARAPDLPKI